MYLKAKMIDFYRNAFLLYVALTETCRNLKILFNILLAIYFFVSATEIEFYKSGRSDLKNYTSQYRWTFQVLVGVCVACHAGFCKAIRATNVLSRDGNTLLLLSSLSG